MITYISQRYEPWGGVCGDPVEKQQTSGKAVVSLIRYELGYGGSITDVTSTRIEVRTSMMGRYDITTWEGSEEEMEPLLRAISVWYGVKQKRGAKYSTSFAQKLIKSGLNKPIHVAMGAILAQGGLVVPVLCAVAGLSTEDALRLQDRTSSLADEQFQAQPMGWYRQSLSGILSDIQNPLFELLIDGEPFEETLALAA